MAGFTVAQPGGYSADLDALLVRRDLFNSGGLWGWGNNNTYGQNGTGTTNGNASPQLVSGGGLNWRQATVFYHGMAIKTDGTLWTWGRNAAGQLGIGSTGDATNTSSPNTVAGGGTTWSSVATTIFSQTSAAIKTDGSLWTWGACSYGHLAQGTKQTNTSSPGTTVTGGLNWKQVCLGSNMTVAIKTDGTLWTCGYAGGGALGNNSFAAPNYYASFITTAGGGTTWSQVSCGYGHVGAIKTDGTLWMWGGNYQGQIGTGTSTPNRYSSPTTTAGGGTNWKYISCGSYFNLAIKTDGTLWSWGQNGSGQLANSLAANTSSPNTVAGGGTTWRTVAGGFFCPIAIKTDGTLWTSGQGTSSFVTVAGAGNNWKSVTSNNMYMAISDNTY